MSVLKPHTSADAVNRVLVIGAALEAAARDAFTGATVESGDVSRMPNPDANSASPDLVVLDAAAAEPHALAAAIDGMAAMSHPPMLILSGNAAPTAVVRAMMRLPQSDLLEPPFGAADLSQTASRLNAQAAAKSAPAPAPAVPIRNRCWAVTSAVGGGGGTTVAVELANAIRRVDPRKPKVCLIDLNLADGAAAAYLGAQANLNLDPTAISSERVDASLLDVMVSRPRDYLDLLASPRNPNAFSRVSSEVVLRLLDVACTTYPHVIIDMPRHRHEWTLAALGGCDEVLVVSELTVPALLAARSLAEELEDDLPAGPKPRIVLNRLASRMFGPAPSMAEAERALGRNADAGISSDWEAAAASVNLGGSISEHRPKSKIVRDIEALAKLLIDTKSESAGQRAA